MEPELPQAPPIDGEAMLEIFVHASIRFPGTPMNSESLYGDGTRLAALGSKMLEAAYTNILFNKRPLMPADELEAELNALPSLIDKWVDGYRWREKVRCARDTDLKDPKETCYLMHAYVGAVAVGGGFKAVLNWVQALVDPDAPAEPEVKRTRVEPSMPPYPYPRQPAYQPAGYGMPAHMQHMAPPPPAVAPPPLPAPMGNPLAPAQPQAAFLPLFNQTAQQRRLHVEYTAEFTGPPHAGTWSVTCLVNGMIQGQGTGTSKQLAKEDAARKAYHSMGWAPRV